MVDFNPVEGLDDDGASHLRSGLFILIVAGLTAALARGIRPAIIHCHGAKGGLYGRLAARRLGIPSVYTPHGGSLHYEWASPSGAVFLTAERLLAKAGFLEHRRLRVLSHLPGSGRSQRNGLSGHPGISTSADRAGRQGAADRDSRRLSL